jgi:hypothetical protein
MCLIAKINDQEFMCFYLNEGRVELRDEKFQALPAPKTGVVMVKDDPNALNPSWHEVPATALVNLARTRMRESLQGLKQLCQT